MAATRYTALAASREGKLFGCDWIDIYASTASIETNIAVHERENGVIAAEANVFAREKFRASLAHNDIAGEHHFAAESFYAEPLADAVAAVLNATLSFFVCHF